MRKLNLVTFATTATMFSAIFVLYSSSSMVASAENDLHSSLDRLSSSVTSSNVRARLGEEDAAEFPEIETCSEDGGCPLSAMAYATGSFTNEFLLSESALQSASNMTLHIHLCCGYTIRGELLTNATTYTRFLVEMLHVSPLSHLSVREQLAIFPHEQIALTKQTSTGTRRYTPADFVGKNKADIVDDAYDGDILTLVVQPQGPEFKLMPAAKAQRYGSHRSGRPAEVEHYGIDYDLTYSDPNHLLQQGGSGSVGTASADEDTVVTEFQLFVPNLAINCKCPHTLPVLPLLKFRRDTLPPLELVGLGARCITNNPHTTPVGPWSRVIYSLAKSTTENRDGRTHAVRTRAARRGGDASEIEPISEAELKNLVLTSDTVIANTYFSVAPAQLPAFSRLQWRVYEVSDALAAELSTAALSGASSASGSSFASAGTGAEAELLGQYLGGEGINADAPIGGNFRSTIDEQNFVVRSSESKASQLLAKAEREALKSAEKAIHLKLVASSLATTNMTHSDGNSERFEVRPNLKYLITVDVRRGEARQVLRGLFVLRIPAWLAQPSQFLALEQHPTATQALLRLRTVTHDHMLLGARQQLGFSKVALDGPLDGQYRRVWAPMESMTSQRIRSEECLAKFKALARQRDEQHRASNSVKVSSASEAGGLDLPDGHYSDYFQLFASAEARARSENERRARLEAKLVLEADRAHSIAMADAYCRDIFAILSEQARRGQPLRVTDDAFASPRSLVTSTSSSSVVRSDVLPQQVRYLRDPSATLFSFDNDAYRYENFSSSAHVLVDHIHDNAWYTFPLGTTSVSVWIVDRDGACNATRAEVANVHTIRPVVDRPSRAASVRPVNETAPHSYEEEDEEREITVCTRSALLEAKSIASVVAKVKSIFPQLDSAGFEASAEWVCYDKTRALANKGAGEESSSAEIDAYMKANGEGLKLPMTKVVSASSSASSSSTTLLSSIASVAAYVNMTAQSTARCFFTIKATKVPAVASADSAAAAGGWLLTDGSSAKTTRGPSYFNPTQDMVLEFPVTVHCRASDLPLQVFVDVDTKSPRFTVSGLPTTSNGRWEISNSAPIRHIGSAGDATHLFELLDTDMFDIALDEASRSVPLSERSYALQHNATSRYAYIVLAAKSLVFKINYDATKVCPEGEVEVVLRLLQTPPALVPTAAEEIFIEEPSVVVERPRAPTPDEVVQWSVVSTSDIFTLSADAETKAAVMGYLGLEGPSPSAVRAEQDRACANSIRFSLHDSEDSALSGAPGVTIDSYSTRRAANSKRFVRVSGVPEGSSCVVQWRAANAAGAVSHPIVIHRCRSPPTVSFYTEAPQVRAVSTFDRRQVYDETYKLRPSLAIAGVALYPIAGRSATVHYRLASSSTEESGLALAPPIANDPMLTDSGRMRVLIEFDSAARFPYIYNVSELSGVQPFVAHTSTHEAALFAEKMASASNQRRGGASSSTSDLTLAFKGRTATDVTNLFGSGILEFNGAVGVAQNSDKGVCMAYFTDLGNATRQLFIATVEVDKETEKAPSATDVLVSSAHTPRVRDVFQQRRLCRTSHRPFALFSLAPETVLGLQEHQSTRNVENRTTGAEGKPVLDAKYDHRESASREPLQVRFCTAQYHFFVRRELYTVLGYDFDLTCDGAFFVVQKKSETEIVVTPAQEGRSSATCLFTVSNHATRTKESVYVQFTSVTNSATAELFNLYLLPDVASELADGATVENLNKKYLSAGTTTIVQGANVSSALFTNAKANSKQQHSKHQKPEAQMSAAEKRRLRYKALKVKKAGEEGEQIVAPTHSLAKSAIVAVGRSVELVAYSKSVTPFSGQWRVLNMIPYRDLATSNNGVIDTSSIVTSGGYLAATRIRETSADLGCADSCISGTFSHIPASGLYSVGYSFPDTKNPDVCPASTATRNVFVFLAEVITTDVVTCVPNVTIKAVPLPPAHRADHYGRWSIVTHHTSPTDVSPNPEEYITFDNQFKDTTVVRGLRFGVVRLRWNIYRNGTNELLDSAIVVVKVITDSLPSDRVVTFKDSAVVQTTSSTINWRALRPNIRVSFRAASYDPAISGELHVSHLPLGTTKLRYDAVRSARAAQFPMLAHLECPKRSQGDFFIERVAASLTAGTTMRVECHAYSGQGVITIRLATGGSDDIRLVASDRLQSLIFNGTRKLQQDRPRCRAPWWAREEASRWLNVSYFDNDRAVNITVRATEYLSQEELETVPFFSTGGQSCPESGGFISSAVIEGVPHDGNSALYVPIVDPVSARLHSNFYLRPIEGHRGVKTTGESSVSSGNASIDIALTRGASFGFRSNETLLRMCLRGEVPLSAIAAPWTAANPPTSFRGQQSWERYVAAAAGLSVRCEPLVYLPHGSISQAMTITQLESQLQVIHQDTVQTLRNRNGIDVHGLSRSTQMALAARRVTAAQLAEILHRNRRMEAERLARAQSPESDADRFERVMRLSTSVFGDDAVVTAIRVTLPAYPAFFTTEDILLNVRVSKATVCSISKDDPHAPTNASGHGQASFGQLLIEDEPVSEEVTPSAFSQCQFESAAPVFNLNVRNGAFRPDASLSTCRIELIDDGIVNITSANEFLEANSGVGPYEALNNGRGPISSLSGGSLGHTSPAVGLHACFTDFLRNANFHTDPLSQKKIALQLSSCPSLKMLDLDEYNSYEPLRRTAFFRRMTQSHHMRVVLHNCVIPDKHTHPKNKRGFGPNAYVDGVFSVVVKPTMAHLRVLSSKHVPAAQQQLVDPESSEHDRLLLCEGDVQERGALLGIELSGDRWHPAVGERGSSSRGGASTFGSRNVAMLNSFSVVEKEEYLMMQQTGESVYERRQRIAKLVDSRYDASDETFVGGVSRRGGSDSSKRYEDLAHASSGAYTTNAVKVSKFMHYMYKQFWAQQNQQQASSPLRHLVTRYNDTFVTIQIPEDASIAGTRGGAQHTMQAYQRYASGYGQNQQKGSVIDSAAWGFGGVVEEVRIAIPGVTTTCNACLLTDVNFYFAGDFAGSVSLFSQRALSHRLMADRAQLEAPVRLAISQLEEDQPIVFHHHWMCPNTAARRLQNLVDLVRTPQFEYTHPGQRNLLGGMGGPTVELVITIDLGKDTPPISELNVDDQQNSASPAPSALMRTSIVFRNATLPSGEKSSELHATVVLRSAQASALPSRIIHELEVSMQFMPETLSVGHRAIAAAMRKRKSRLGYYGAQPEDLAFSGVVTLRTCVDENNCMETASRGIVVGPWEAEVAPVVTPQQGATLDRSYVAESQRRVNRVVHTVRSGFVVFILFALHHVITAYVILRLKRGPSGIAVSPGSPLGSMAAGGGAFQRGRSPDPNSDSFNIHPAGVGGYAPERSRSVSLADLDGPTTSNTAVFFSALVVAALLSHYAFFVWAALWMVMWALIIVAQRGRQLVTFAAFLIHFMLFIAAVKNY